MFSNLDRVQITETPQVARADGEQKTGSAKAGNPVAQVPFVDYDPILRDEERQRARHAERLRKFPWLGPRFAGD